MPECQQRPSELKHDSKDLRSGRGQNPEHDTSQDEPDDQVPGNTSLHASRSSTRETVLRRKAGLLLCWSDDTPRPVWEVALPL